MAKINVGLSEPLLERGFRQYVVWDLQKAPHAAIQGATGMGKTYLLKLLLARISKNIPNSKITVCDFKGDRDFEFLDGLESFYRFSECLTGLDMYYENFLSIQKHGNQTGTEYFFVFDEWASFLNSLEKKEVTEAKRKLASLMMLGRSFSCHVVLSQQRLDADYFEKARDNINLLITLGNPSRQVVEMFYLDVKEHITMDRKRGTGFMLTNGSDLQKIVVPEIQSMERVNRAIYEAVERAGVNSG